MQSIKQKTQQKNPWKLWAAAAAAFIVILLSIFAFANIANADNNGISCAYKQTGPSSATIQVTGVSSYTATSSDTNIATVTQDDEMVTVTGVSGAVGVVNINISYSSSSTYAVAVPIGYTVFSFDDDELTVMPGNGTNYEINGIDYTLSSEVAMSRINPESEPYPIYKNDTDASQRAKLNINLKKKGGTYVFTGTGNNMSIAVAKAAATTSTILMADCHLTSGVTSPLTIKKEGTVQTVVTALEGHSNSLVDNEFNNADIYGPTEEGGSGENQYWAESAVIKGKANANLLLNGTGNLTLDCKSKNAVKIGDAGNLTIENINLDVESVDHGLSSDNTATVNSGSIIINSATDAFRSDPDTVVAGTTSGSIAINGGTFNIVTSSTGDGIQAASTLIITGGCFNIKTYGGSSTEIGEEEDISAKGIKSGTTMAITDGDFVFDCADDAIHAESDCTISGGEFKIATGDDGIHAGDSDTYPSAKLTLGTLNSELPKVYITTCYEGLEAPQVIINSGIYSIEGSDDGINAANGTSAQPGQSSGCNIVVNGGSIYVNVDGDGFDANGNLTINAGTCIVFGQTSSGGDNNPYDCDGTFTINGGTVFGAGGNNPAATAPSSGSQGYVTYGGSTPGPGPGPRPGGSSSNASDITSGKTIDVKNASSTTAFSIKTPKTVNYVIYSDSSNPTSSWSITGDNTTPTWTWSKLNMPTCLTNGHSYTSTTIIEPTCLGAGTIKKTCSECGATSYETVDALGHDMHDNICSRCGYTDGVSIADATFTQVDPVTYTGEAFAPTPTVSLNGSALTKDTDYTLSYTNNVSAGTATIKATGKGSYTGTATTIFTINKAAIDYPSAVVPSWTYDGTEKIGVPFGTGYSITDNKKTNAGSYTAYATPDSNHMWQNESTTAWPITWTINQADGSINFNVSSATVLINGTETITPTIVTDGSFASCTSSDTSTLTASYSTDTGKITLKSPGNKTGDVTVTLSFAEGTNYNAVSAQLTVNVNTIGTAATPVAITGLVYNGSSQTGVIAGTGYTVTGNVETNAGTHTAVATLNSGYTWADGYESMSRDVEWSISKANGSVTISASTATVSYGTDRKIGVTILGDGAVTATSSKTSVAKVSYSNSQITITPKSVSDDAVTITVKCADGTNYFGATDTCTIYVIKGTGSTNISKESVSLPFGGSATATVSVEGDGTTTAASSDEGVATASLNGTTLTINAIAKGNATITVSTTEGTNYTASSDTCAVSVYIDRPILEDPVVSGTNITLNWSEVPDATKYAVSIRKTGTTSWTTLCYDCTAKTYTIKDLEENVTYDCLVQAFLNGKWSTFSSSDIKQATTASIRPVATATATGDGEITLSWAPIDGATKYAISEVIGSGFKEVDYNISGTSYVVEDLANKVKHTFLVQAFVNGKWSKYDTSNYVSATPDGNIKPYDISTVSGSNSIQLTWGRVSGASAYAVSIKKADGSYDIKTTSIKQPSKGVESVNYTVGGLSNSTQYTFLVQAFVNSSWSRYTEDDHVKASTISIKPQASAQATENDGEIKVSWQAVENATQYACSEYLGNGKFDIHIVGTDLQCIASDLVAQREHKFLVQAYVAGSWSSYTEEDYVGAIPTGSIKPTNITTTPGYTSIQLDWDKVPGATKYAVALRNNDKTYKLLSTSIPKSDNPTFTASGLKGSTEYTFLVQAFVDGSWSRYVEADHVVESTISTKPQATAEATQNDGEIKVSWLPVESATQYACSEYLGDGKFDVHIVGTDLQYIASDLVAQREHKFLVQAYVAGGWSPYTEADFVGATPTGDVKPTISSTSSTETAITINWDLVPGSDEYAASITTDEVNWTIHMVDKTKTTFTFTGLKSSTTYKVLTQRRVGNSWNKYTSSDIKTVTTKQPSRTAYNATGSRQNAILCNATTSAYDCIKVEKSGDGSSEDDDFYGYNAAILSKAGGLLTISDAIINTAAKYANAVFSYGSGTTIDISNSTINTSANNSGGVMVTGGGTLTATDVDATTTGDSSAPIRSDKGGGTLTTNRGTYISKGIGSPAIYSTAAIKCIGSTLTSNHSEGVIVEGKNSATLNNCTLTDTNDKLNGKSTTYKNVFLYQSQSGDAEVGTAKFTATDSNITTNKGDSFYVTNNTAQIDLTNNTVTNNDSTGYLLRAKADAWGKTGKNGGLVTFNLTNQKVTGNIYIDNISTLAMSMKSGSKYTGTINGANTAKTLSLNLSADSNIVLTGDSYLTSFTDADTSYSNVDTTNGHLYVNGVKIK